MKKPGNKILFYSPLFGYVEMYKRGLAVRETYFKGQLKHDWVTWFRSEQRGMEYFYFRKGETIWLGRDHFRVIC